MSYESQMDVTPSPVMDFDKLNAEGMDKGIPSSMIYQVYTKDGLAGLAAFVKGWKGYDKQQHRGYLDQHHNVG